MRASLRCPACGTSSSQPASPMRPCPPWSSCQVRTLSVCVRGWEDGWLDRMCCSAAPSSTRGVNLAHPNPPCPPAALERVALRGCPHVTTSGVHLLLQRSGLRHIVVSKCRQVSVESLCGEVSFKVVTDPGGAAPAAPAPDAAPAAAPAVHVAAADLVPVMLDF